MSERTPGPWTLSGKQTIRAGNAWIGKTNWSNGAANAEFIVRACNVHDELVAALEPFAKFACDEPCDCFNCRARAAIAKAKGEV